MADRRQAADFRDIRALFHVGTTGDLTDQQLLEQFVSGDREAAEMAFKALVVRHGPMVLRVCRMVLRDLHEAEDAFQATFLVLVAPGRIDPQARVGSELAARRRPSRRLVRALGGVAAAVARARRAAEMARRSADDAHWDDLGEAVHEEIGRLPESCRAAIVLCDLEGLTEGQAARGGWVGRSGPSGADWRGRSASGPDSRDAAWRSPPRCRARSSLPRPPRRQCRLSW